jgi:hypothetical protein
MKKNFHLSVHCDNSPPKVKFSHHDWFYTVDLRFDKDEEQKITIFIDSLQSIVNLKNSFLSSYNKLIEERL